MKRKKTVFVRMKSAGKKPMVMWWPGTVISRSAGTVTVEFNQPWRDGTTVVQVRSEDLG